ncbi:UPF0187-domain-containing protein [Gonapodya prolifera JEL478]|uniref:UPF0187-domain-containing protein n=1 Tax=Gonapodya prolifera (strain JEL478) TaxID=1344416 RepID=A0A139B0T7_GONPJ|nr:UPF0187-domain-containing protein [Gonapodya prolifera JEL478]|eukprot:KXS22560.1 UPF0187-domain-containing protein [Gonapodya prolifera JEL478]
MLRTLFPETYEFWTYALQPSSSSKTLPSVGLIVAWTTLVTISAQLGSRVLLLPAPVLSNLIGLALALLLGFRSNQAFTRYAEGRLHWTSLVAKLRLCVIDVVSASGFPDEGKVKLKTTKILIAIAYATKHYLRGDSLSNMTDLEEFVTIKSQSNKASTHKPGARKLPLDLLVSLNRVAVDSQISCIRGYIGGIVDDFGALERVDTTPLPPAYTVLLRRLLFLHLLTLPMQYALELRWSTPVVVGLVAWALLSVEWVAGIVDGPFGFDDEDLDLDRFCRELKEEFEAMLEMPLNPDPTVIFAEVQTTRKKHKRY